MCKHRLLLEKSQNKTAMSLLHNLLDTSYQDTQFLIQNDEKGDHFQTSRQIDFILYSQDQEKAETFCEFVNDNQYGEARYENLDKNYRITVAISMPSTQNLICSLSALMTCLAELFGVEYDGWGCELQTK